MSVSFSKPDKLPNNPCFSSGPCAKRPGWNLSHLQDALVGRSHRSGAGRKKLAEVIDRSAAILGIPEGWKVGIIPASDTGAVELALWSLLGSRPVDILSFDSFSAEWVKDVTQQLELAQTRVIAADYGELPQLQAIQWDRDVVIVWNGTTSGVKIPNGDFIPEDRKGLVICDATSAVFAMEMPWEKLDVVTWSWQKVLGGEAAHGMIALSPKAIARLEGECQPRPLPKIFRLTKNGKLDEKIFRGDTINTPSMLCVEDALDGLQWAETIGGLPALIARSQENLKVVTEWVEKTTWLEFLCKEEANRSNTAICLKITDPWFQQYPVDKQRQIIAQMAAILEKENAAYDIASYREAPPGLRIWGGATVESDSIRDLLPWLDWAYAQVKSA
ncbi:MAG: phosphoserine transaminase [Commensalibacter sp.]|nr:phosphoserine transaminase [Commensalibacter sp.]